MARVTVSDHYTLTIGHPVLGATIDAKIGDDPEQPPVARRGASRRTPKVPAAGALEKRRQARKAQRVARKRNRR